MTMSYIWAAAVILSIIYGAAVGNGPAVGSALFDGATAAVELCLSIGGMICLWSAIMELMNRCGLTAAISRMLAPLLNRLFPSAKTDRTVQQNLSLNVSANLLGLGNAATPAGIRAMSAMAAKAGSLQATNEMCRLVVMNTASIQLIPTTIAAVRAACGAQQPFDILPAVWITSLCSVTAGLLCAKILEKPHE